MTQWGLDALFNPAKRHMDEEKRRLQSTREEIGDSSGGKRIDFESGKVTIQRATDEEPAEQDENVAAESSDGGTSDGAKADAETKRELTPAQKRAAERRRRRA